ncbi:VOC family protein [Alteromonas sp. KUL49]|uniref:VOC family protein n=1 Tax=Alteromonas sp. KUL49 TaxID=2480798 RepID=UPI00102EEDE5|nr:VOC family protein [Alteromonas sp. KUL49]TAP42598.1 VOC family protein [Alteromonas sp. KUL49]GEA10238.1 hypothetical protein KUL49_06130 [Alteromonas sp. KUL49]
MTNTLATTTLFVSHYDDAISFFVDVLNFTLTQNISNPDGSRFVVVTPSGGDGGLLLSEANTAIQKQLVGNQAGDNVFMIMTTSDFWSDYHRMEAAGVVFTESPRDEPYGMVVIFKDCAGNQWDLIQPKP